MLLLHMKKNRLIIIAEPLEVQFLPSCIADKADQIKEIHFKCVQGSRQSSSTSVIMNAKGSDYHPSE